MNAHDGILRENVKGKLKPLFVSSMTLYAIYLNDVTHTIQAESLLEIYFVAWHTWNPLNIVTVYIF